jgi:hypothetical protein
MTATLAAPAPAPLPAVSDADLPTAAFAPRADLPAAPTATQSIATEDAAVLPPIEPSAAAVTVVEPSAAPVSASAPTAVALETPSRATTGRPSWWLTGLLALGVVIVLVSAPLFVARRRKRQAAAQAAAKIPEPRAARRPVDPIGGIEVIEAGPTRSASADEASNSANAESSGSGVAVTIDLDDLAMAIGPTDSVDVDVGAPVVLEERVDWFAKGTDAAVVDEADSGKQATEENAATARMPGFETVAVVADESSPSKAGLAEPTMDDQPTLTIVDLDMLRQDYEAEHTMTQQANKALRDAIADLEATKAAHAAAADAPTAELPQQPHAEATTRTARVRAK